MGVTAPEAEPTHPPRPEPASPLAAESVQADPEPEEEDEAPLAPPPRTRRPDEAALAILREEAEREAAAAGARRPVWKRRPRWACPAPPTQ